MPKRALLTNKKECIEINLSDYIVVFSKDRPMEIKETSTPYDVRYKKIGSFWGHTIKNVVFESIFYEKTENPIKYLITENGERWEIPMKHFDFFVSKQRLLSIQNQMEIEVGQAINAIK